MHPRTLLLSGALTLGFASLGSAQTLTFDNATFANGTYYYTNVYEVGQVAFNDSALKSGGFDYAINPVGAKKSLLTFADGSQATAYDFCSELFDGPTGTSTYNLSFGLGNYTASQQSAIGALFSNALPLFITQENTIGGAVEIYGAALQMALWEIVEDGSPYFTLDELDPQNALQTLSVNLAATGGSGSDEGQAFLLAESWLDQISSGSWTDQGGLFYAYADTNGDQNRLLVSLTPIPEPSVALLGLMGGLLAFRRRR